MALVEERESVQTGGKDATALLKADHRKVSDLLKEFEEAEGARKRKIATQICNELTVHARIEEEIFYPAARQHLQGEDQELVNEADVEHATIKGLVGRIEKTAMSDEHFEAFVTVLGEYVKHHVKEEENELFPKLKRTGLDLRELGTQLEERKMALQARM